MTLIKFGFGPDTYRKERGRKKKKNKNERRTTHYGRPKEIVETIKAGRFEPPRKSCVISL
jgi:hypothetical protein